MSLPVLLSRWKNRQCFMRNKLGHVDSPGTRYTAVPGHHPVTIFTWPHPLATSSRESFLIPFRKTQLVRAGSPPLTNCLLPEILFLKSFFF